MKYKLNGISTPFGGVSWDKCASEKDVVKFLFRFLSSKRILTNPLSLEIPEQCVDSVLEIRSAFVDITKDIDVSDKLWREIKQMIDLCNTYLDTLNKLNLPHIIYKNDNNWADSSFDSAIKGFRNGIHESVVHLEKMYKLNSNIIFSDKW